MKQKLVVLLIAVVAVAILLLVSGCSKKTTPSAQPATPQAPTTPVATTPVQQTAQAQEPLPDLSTADQAAQGIGTSDLDQADRNIDTLAVP